VTTETRNASEPRDPESDKVEAFPVDIRPAIKRLVAVHWILLSTDLLDPETGPQALPTLFLLLFFMLSDFQSTKALSFSADRYKTFHTYQQQYSASSYRGGFLT